MGKRSTVSASELSAQGHSLSIIPTNDLHYFLDEIADGLYIADDTGILKYANRRLAGILGMTATDEVVGHRLSEFVEPDFAARLRDLYVRAAAESSTTFRDIMRMCLPDGSRAWIEVRVKIAGNGSDLSGFSGIVRDITEQRSANEALKANEALYHSIVEMSPDAIVTMRMDKSISTANNQAILLFGYEGPADFLGRDAFALILPEERRGAEMDLKKVLISGSLQNQEYRLMRKDGTVFWAEVSGGFIPETEGKEAEILVTVRDISKRKGMEENLRNLSVTDELTGLYNRRGFSFAAEQELKHAHRTKKGMALLFFDMDKLKSINDNFGHVEGDEALKAAVMALRSTFRESDIIGRWGGDEFIVLALDVPEGSIAILQRRFEENLARRNAAEGIRYPISLSAGIARYDPENPSTLHEMIKMADATMYEGKQGK